jgi:hypothetical protein
LFHGATGKPVSLLQGLIFIDELKENAKIQACGNLYFEHCLSATTTNNAQKFELPQACEKYKSHPTNNPTNKILRHEINHLFKKLL